MSVKQCKVFARDVSGVEHSVTVNADSLYVAVALGVAELRRHRWIGDLVDAVDGIRVVSREAHETEHTLSLKKITDWASTPGARSPAETVRKATVREKLGISMKSA